ncbi:hypothetical protein CVT24_006382 [Panaeolus cyanescens]|uniref:SUN domain-containing protein n=1 Tax=Panaeolus cyanescens TaxID=181874 RepID=A0A409WHP7_9AGAR|nr:hypothetical protein CVT24_006382 [Panaeolus cyanescens]
MLSAYLVFFWHKKITIQRDAADLYWEDWVGRRDFASRFSGAQIVEFLTTPPPGAQQKPVHPAYLAIDSALDPTKCWNLDSSLAQIAIRFAGPVGIEHLTIDDIPKELLSNSEMRSAPRELVLWGFKHLNQSTARKPSQVSTSSRPMIFHDQFDFVLLRKVEYDIKAKQFIQTYPIKAHANSKVHECFPLDFLSGSRTVRAGASFFVPLQ